MAFCQALVAVLQQFGCLFQAARFLGGALAHVPQVELLDCLGQLSLATLAGLLYGHASGLVSAIAKRLG